MVQTEDGIITVAGELLAVADLLNSQLMMLGKSCNLSGK